MWKSIVTAAALLVAACASAPKYGVTEGPFRAEFKPRVGFHIMDKGKPYEATIMYKGVLPEEPLHIEGYINGKLRFHTDAILRIRTQRVRIPFSLADYCAVMYQPQQDFYSRGPAEQLGLVEQDDAMRDEGTANVSFHYYALDVETGRAGRLLTRAAGRVKISCSACNCRRQY